MQRTEVLPLPFLSMCQMCLLLSFSSLLESNCFTMLWLVSPVQHESAICAHVSPPSGTSPSPHPTSLGHHEHQAELPVLCSNFQLVIYFRHVMHSIKMFLILCYPQNYSPPGSSLHGILQARTLEQVVISSFRFYTWQYIYANATLSVPPILSFSNCVHSIHPYIYSCPANRFICTIFLDV